MRRLVFTVFCLFSIAVLSPASVRAQSCGTAPAPRLITGQPGYVAFTDGRPINVREQPSREGALTGQLPEGTAFTVVEGPTCAGDINWWRIESSALSGWIAEGLEGQYFVAPGDVTREIDLAGLADAPEDGDCGELPTRTEGEYFFLEPAMGITLVLPPFSEGGEPFRLGNNDWVGVYDGPICRDGSIWWDVEGQYYGQLPETLDGVYVMQPLEFDPAPPVPLDVPMVAPVVSSPDVPLPAMTPDQRVVAGTFSQWTWDGPNDPTQLVLPEAYAGDLPALPIDLDNVRFVAGAGLNDTQLALLAQNGFVVVPGAFAHMDEVYQHDATWQTEDGKGDFITTDVALHTLYMVYENTLKFLEMEQLYGRSLHWIATSYRSAEAEYLAAKGTAAEDAARRAAVYYGVAYKLILPGLEWYIGAIPPEEINYRTLMQNAPAEIVADVDAIAALAEAEEGVLNLPLMENYEEDFTQYKPRGYYTGDQALTAYFRAMMWAGRVTFRTKSQMDTQTGLFTLKALRDGGGLDAWHEMDQTLAWLVGPVDDLSPTELIPLAEQTFGADLSAEALSNPELLTAYIDALKALPGPRINSLPLPVGITGEELDEFTRGFRVFGQRFTFDAYIFQNLIYPAVGERVHSRVLPMAEDVPAALGSDLAFVQTEAAGATTYVHYTENLARLRTELNGISAEMWSENLYGAWLHTLQSLAAHDPALLPPFMQTDAWKYKDMNTLLGSLAELKHASLLYAEQAYGGFGGGGWLPPVMAYSLVEPNPLVFARVAVIARQLQDGLEQRGYAENSNLLTSVMFGTSELMRLSADLAEMARKEIAGEPLTYDEYYGLQEHFGQSLWMIRAVIEEALGEAAPDRMALIADVASNPTIQKIYYMATGDADLIYVVANGPFGLHLTRGAVYSSYQFEGDYQTRLTDEDWRAQVEAGSLPPLPVWTETYRAE